MSVVEHACHRCGLSGTHPLARLNEGECCAVCRRSENPRDRERRRVEILRRMEELFEQLRACGGTRVLLAYSGGKDSSWTLVQLRRRFGLEVRALTVDNGFLSEFAHENASRLASAVGAEHVVVRPPRRLLRRLFRAAVERSLFSPTALTRASSICNACIAVVKSICLREALAHRMDVVAWGWTPGQAPLSSAFLRPRPALLRQLVRQLSTPLRNALGEEAKACSANEAGISDGAARVHLVSPLAVLDYDETRMLDELLELGWVRPRDVDPHSTNCRLNLLASHEHVLRHGFHPYALEMAALVREGLLDPEEARHRLHEEPDFAQLDALADELGLTDRTRRELGIVQLQ